MDAFSLARVLLACLVSASDVGALISGWEQNLADLADRNTASSADIASNSSDRRVNGDGEMYDVSKSGRQVVFEWGGLLEEDFGKVVADVAYVEKCARAWQAECQTRYRDAELRGQLCTSERYAHRPHVLARLLVPREKVWAANFVGPDARFRRDHLRSCVSLVPRLTEEGYRRERLPEPLHEQLRAWLAAHRHFAKPEKNIPVSGVMCGNAFDGDDWTVMDGWAGNLTLLEALAAELRPRLEEWSGTKLKPDPLVFGPRLYHEGSVCGMHTDRKTTHAVSVIVTIDYRDLEQPWPLHILTHQGKERALILKPGDLIFYESASLPHGRREPLRGGEVANLFVHFEPVDWSERLKRQRSQPLAVPPEGLGAVARVRPLAPTFEPSNLIYHASDDCLPLSEPGEASTIAGTPVLDAVPAADMPSDEDAALVMADDECISGFEEAHDPDA